MANEAFALSPITARPVQPGEEDYHAISEAFMETARGRWFLTEYAKRNRNADTRLVLDAVARLEESLAAQKQAVEPPDQGPAVAEAIAAIRDAVEAAQASAAEALDSLALEQKLAPVRKGARVIREIAWRLREIGNDGRICDLIDSQVVAIENGAALISSEEAKAALDAAFAPIVQRLAQFSEADETPAPSAEAPVAAPSPPPESPAEERSPRTTEVEAPAEAPAAVETVAAPPEAEAAEEAITAGHAEAALAVAEAALAEAEAIELARATEEAAADAHDEAVLDMIAMEMGAPDPFEVEDATATIAEPLPIEPEAPAEPEIVPQAPELAATMPEPQAELPPQPSFVALPEPIEISLGSTIIASGIVKKPIATANDPLAPIRRMSQAEKIAFFS
ncbi:hypothetical protein [Bradyrhizobium sp. USDA 10063]